MEYSFSLAVLNALVESMPCLISASTTPAVSCKMTHSGFSL